MTSLKTEENKIIQGWEELGYNRWRLDGHYSVTCLLWKVGESGASIEAEGPTILSAMQIALGKAAEKAILAEEDWRPGEAMREWISQSA